MVGYTFVMTSHVRTAPDASAFGMRFLLCFVWGFTQVISKLTAPGISLVMQSGLRSAISAVLLLLWALARHVARGGCAGWLGNF